MTISAFAGLYIVASLICFVMYATDKSAAIAGRRRISERALLMWGLVCGWPGGFLAQQLLRHKTRKASFLLAFWATVVVNLLAVVAILKF